MAALLQLPLFTSFLVGDKCDLVNMLLRECGIPLLLHHSQLHGADPSLCRCCLSPAHPSVTGALSWATTQSASKSRRTCCPGAICCSRAAPCKQPSPPTWHLSPLQVCCWHAALPCPLLCVTSVQEPWFDHIHTLRLSRRAQQKGAGGRPTDLSLCWFSSRSGGAQ